VKLFIGFFYLLFFNNFFNFHALKFNLIKINVMSMLKEFKEFAMRGNVVDMAVGIIIGGAFGKIVSSIVADVIMPPIGLLLGGVKFTDLKIILKEPVLDAAGAVTTAAVSVNYGNFIQVTVDFIIIAFAIFMMIKAMNKMKKKEVAAPAAPPAPPVPTKEEVLLSEIRDILKEKK
jgi:large conductance mechanosensitive channel